MRHGNQSYRPLLLPDLRRCCCLQVIMWPPCQDCWKHEVQPWQTKPPLCLLSDATQAGCCILQVLQVPEESRVEPHAISGQTRINLTFRRLKSSWAQRVPQCRCNRQATLKARANSSTHGPIYYYSCDNTQGPSCGFYSPQHFDVTGD